MRKFKYLLLIILLLQFLPGFSQQQEKVETDSISYEVRYKKLKDLYLQRLESESYKAFEKIRIEYTGKLNLQASDTEEFGELGFLEWAKANIYKTDFTTIEEIEKEWAKFEVAVDDDAKKNVEYYKYLNNCVNATGSRDIINQVKEEVRQTNPEKFAKPVYKKKKSYLPKLPGATP